ncbi:MAG TPA: hypothetical protein VK519_10895 [Pinirhizobacter sp.]|uniref:hypothetical protein n=1 Tax=Pinirhizobacter sp. TaxID=2950432 RepID=UPI002BE27966|nr:hypothetical protein [Pinirhizobacter sp.]HMH68419.1 hypothetical protein [Pinirhizobacter sp.]
MTDTPACEVSTLRLFLLRGVYLFIALGLALTVWPDIIAPSGTAANPQTVILALLGGLAVMCALGLRYPMQMIPILLFELIWKVIWVVAFAFRMWLHGGLDEYAAQTLFACMMGVVLVPIALPWGYVYRRYIKAPMEPWRAKRPT